jgi:hypothetical protein
MVMEAFVREVTNMKDVEKFVGEMRKTGIIQDEKVQTPGGQAAIPV